MSVEIKMHVDFKAAMQKAAVDRKIPAAFRRNATQWASGTVKYLKQEMKSGRFFKRAPQELFQRTGMRVKVQGEQATIIIGTGKEIGRDEVVYAAIQERGGWIFAKKARALTIPFPGVKGVAANYRPDSFICNVRGKRTGDTMGIIATKVGKRGRIKPLFLLRRFVYLRPRHWFSLPILERMPELDQALSPEGIQATAAQMVYQRTPEQGGEA